MSRKVNHHAPVAQLDRASDYESEGRAFESLRVRHLLPNVTGFDCMLLAGFAKGIYRTDQMCLSDFPEK